jgi:hypothetical protein
MPGDPNLNIPALKHGVQYGSITAGKPPSAEALFGKDGRPTGTEVRQRDAGNYGDCFLLATAAAYAEFHPQVIQRIFLKEDGTLRTSRSGSATARFFVKDPTTAHFKSARPTLYDGRVPVTESGSPALNKSVGGKTWAPLLEYTFTKFRNQQGGGRPAEGFKLVFDGGYPHSVMQALTGKKAEMLVVDKDNADKIWRRLLKAQDDNDVVVAGTTTSADLRVRVREGIKGGSLDGRAGTSKYDDKRWMEGHAYSAWGDKEHPFAFEKDGVRYVRLRNPFGSAAPGGQGKDGVGVIPFRTFVLRFDQVSIGSGTARDEAHTDAPNEQ